MALVCPAEGHFMLIIYTVLSMNTRSLILPCMLVLASPRKIGTADPIKEIVNIFLTMLGVMLLLIALTIYLKQKGHLQRMRRILAHLFSKYLRRQQYNPMDESMKHVAPTLSNKDQPIMSPSMSHQQINSIPVVSDKPSTVKSEMKRINSYYHEIQ